jgi:hypothetical protein
MRSFSKKKGKQTANVVHIAPIASRQRERRGKQAAEGEKIPPTRGDSPLKTLKEAGKRLSKKGCLGGPA